MFKRSKYARQKIVLTLTLEDRRGGYRRGKGDCRRAAARLNRIGRRAARLELRKYR